MIVDIVYIVSSILFILGLKMLGSPASARRGNLLSAGGMFIAVVVTLLDKQILSYSGIAIGIVIGSIIGAMAASMVAMTGMPELVALFNGFGGISSLFVGWSVYRYQPSIDSFTASTIYLSIFIGGVTFAGSLAAWGKLSGKIGGRAKVFPGQRIINLLMLIGILGIGLIYSISPAQNYDIFIVGVILSILLGIMGVLPIGGADMPVVISLLNSFSGLAASAAGFALGNTLLIIAGSLVGASGIILTGIMCKAMNRSLANVLFSGFGAVGAGSKGEHGEAKSLTVEDAYYMLEAAQSVLIVPGYGLAVAQAQHAARELGEILEENGAEVRYAIHPVAGRMPGHMNVLLSEANVSYDQLVEMDTINPVIETIDVCMVIGANDVVNPAAREDSNSPIYGMPIINADKARNVFVLKRSMAAGFAGIENPLFFKENTRMLFGDAKTTLQGLIAEFKD